MADGGMEKGRDGSADDGNNMRKNALFIGILFISADFYLPFSLH